MTDDAMTDPGQTDHQLWRRIDEAVQSLSQPADGWDTERVWMQVASRTTVPEPAVRELPTRRPITTQPSRRRSRAILFGAGALAVLAIGFVAKRSDWSLISPASNSATATYTTTRAQRAEFALPDGSRVILGPESRLEFNFTSTRQRVVDLTGQAYFGVTHDDARPFIVRAAHSVTTVLGTTFTVRAYDTDSLAEVVVAEGRVALTGGSKEAVLVAGDVGRVAANAEARVVSNVRIADAFGWTRGRLTFDRVALRDIAIELERTYDITIRIPDSVLAARQLSVTLTDESITDMLNTIAPPLGATYVRHGNTITFSAR